jgi:hypothetical protein
VKTVAVLCVVQAGKSTVHKDGYYRTSDKALGFLNIPGFAIAFFKGNVNNLLCRHCGQKMVWGADQFLWCSGICDAALDDGMDDG